MEATWTDGDDGGGEYQISQIIGIISCHYKMFKNELVFIFWIYNAFIFLQISLIDILSSW